MRYYMRLYTVTYWCVLCRTLACWLHGNDTRSLSKEMKSAVQNTTCESTPALYVTLSRHTDRRADNPHRAAWRRGNQYPPAENIRDVQLNELVKLTTNSYIDFLFAKTRSCYYCYMYSVTCGSFLNRLCEPTPLKCLNNKEPNDFWVNSSFYVNCVISSLLIDD